MSLSEHPSSATPLQVELAKAHRERQARARAVALKEAAPDPSHQPDQEPDPEPEPEPSRAIRQHDPGNALWRQYQAEMAYLSIQMPQAIRILDGIPTIRDIIDACIDYYGVSRRDILARQRAIPRLILARHIAMYLARKLTLCSFPEIGRIMDRRDHTTVLFGFRKIEALLDYDEQVCADIEAIKEKLGMLG